MITCYAIYCYEDVNSADSLHGMRIYPTEKMAIKAMRKSSNELKIPALLETHNIGGSCDYLHIVEIDFMEEGDEE